MRVEASLPADERAMAREAIGELLARFGWNRLNDCVEVRYARAVAEHLDGRQPAPGSMSEFKAAEAAADAADVDDGLDDDDRYVAKAMR